MTDAEPHNQTTFRIVQAGNRFVVETNGERGTMDYVTKEAAFEAVQNAAHEVIADGDAIVIEIPGGPGRWPIE